MKIINARTLSGKRLLNEDDVHNSIISIYRGGMACGSFTLNQSGDAVVELGTGAPSERIAFTSADLSGVVSWEGSVATFTHGISGNPQVLVFDSTGEQVMADISYPESGKFSLDLEDRAAVTGTWTAVVFGIDDPSGFPQGQSYPANQRTITLDGDDDAVVEPGNCYVWNLESSGHSLTAAEVPADRSASCEIVINPGANFVVFTNISLTGELAVNADNLCTIRWIGGRAYLVVWSGTLS